MALRKLGGMLFMLLLVMSMAFADSAIEVREFPNPVMAERYRDITASLRCPKCDAQAIDSSNSKVAADMRERVAYLLNDGRADQEILNFMVDRFGEYVLYNPRLDGRTWVLWVLPPGLVFIGGLIVIAFAKVRQRNQSRALTEEEQARLAILINRHRENTE